MIRAGLGPVQASSLREQQEVRSSKKIKKARISSSSKKRMKRRALKRCAKAAVRAAGGAAVGLVAAAVEVPAMVAMAAAKAPLLLAHGWAEQVAALSRCCCGGDSGTGIFHHGICRLLLGCPALLLCVALWPARVAASIPAAAGAAACSAVKAGVAAYRAGSAAAGLRRAATSLSDFHRSSNENAGIVYCCWRRGAAEPGVADVEAAPPPDIRGFARFVTSLAGNAAAREVVFRRLVRLDEVAAPPRAVMAEVAAVLLLLFLVAPAESGNGGGGGDAIGVLRQQMAVAALEEEELGYLQSLVLCEEDDQQQQQKMEAVRKGLLQSFGRRIRGMAAFVSRDAEFEAAYRTYMGSLIGDLISFDEDNDDDDDDDDDDD